MNKDKDELRFYFKKLRYKQSDSDRIHSSKIIREQLLKFILSNLHCKKILIYKEFKSEVIISPIIDKLTSLDYEIFIPVIKNNVWCIKSMNSEEYFKSPNEAGFSSEDIIIVPGLAFSTKGERLGYGSGTYDKWLENNNSLRIGVCFNFQVIESLPQESHDILVDRIVINKRIISANNF